MQPSVSSLPLEGMVQGTELGMGVEQDSSVE